MEITLATLLTEVMEEKTVSVSEAIIHHEEGVDLIPANIELSTLEINLVNAMSREVMLRSLVEAVKGHYRLHAFSWNAYGKCPGVRRQCAYSCASSIFTGERIGTADKNHWSCSATFKQETLH